MIHLALSLLSFLFLSSFTVAVLWGIYVVVGLIVLGTREVLRFYWRKIREEFKWTKKS